MEPIDALHKLIADINDLDAFRARVNEWKATRDSALKAAADLAQKRKETEAAADATIARLQAAQKKTDDSADESKRAINTGNDQIARLEALQKTLDQREKASGVAAAAIAADRQKLDAELAAVRKLKADLDIRQAAMDKRAARLKEAMAG